jgi:predicted SAM-dependent methyltransferase
MNLHVGGEQRKEGWRILNVQPGPHVDFLGDLRDLNQFADDSLENIYASHVLEHVRQTEVAPVIRGVYRTLARGGQFMVSVPDLDVLCRLFISPLAPDEAKWHAMRMIFGGQIDPYDYHYIGFNERFLVRFLADAGFSGVRRVKSLGVFQDTSDLQMYGVPISLNLVATK